MPINFKTLGCSRHLITLTWSQTVLISKQSIRSLAVWERKTTTNLFQECLLSLFIELKKFLYHHDLTCFRMRHLTTQSMQFIPSFCQSVIALILNVIIQTYCFTFMAFPKQPFPKTSPYIRSEGRKIRWVFSVWSKRRDSDRLMSLLWERSVACRCEHGALSILQLRLQRQTKTN